MARCDWDMAFAVEMGFNIVVALDKLHELEGAETNLVKTLVLLVQILVVVVAQTQRFARDRSTPSFQTSRK
ncbi:hypothetical protein ONZ45_g10224 [Pleurotus djamor]|nr:hypothetical protein ONZ45_g10224 [Pleurotus djamor]